MGREDRGRFPPSSSGALTAWRGIGQVRDELANLTGSPRPPTMPNSAISPRLVLINIMRYFTSISCHPVNAQHPGYCGCCRGSYCEAAAQKPRKINTVAVLRFHRS